MEVTIRASSVLTFPKRYAIIVKIPFERRKTGMIILKILLWILLAILLLITVICFLSVRISLGNRSGKFRWKMTVCGIKIDPMRLLGDKESNKDTDKKEKASEKDKKKEKKKPAEKDSNSSVMPEKLSIGTVLKILADVARTALEVLPKSLRIRLKHLNIVVGGADAAQTALNYGRYHAILSGIFALLDDYNGLLYGFRAKRDKVNIQADFLSPKTKAEYELTISFFVWQYFFFRMRLVMSMLGTIIENAEELEGTVNGEATEEKRISEAEKTVTKTKVGKGTQKNTDSKKNTDNGGK